MAVSPIEEKILGRLAKLREHDNLLLSNSLYQVLGLSILLSRKLIKARRTRRLDTTRETQSLQLYHQIIWLAREGLSITEVYILPYTSNGDYAHTPEYRVMAAKLRASFHHIFCLFHNHPPISAVSPHVSPRSHENDSSPSSTRTAKAENTKGRSSTGRSPKNGRSSGERRRRVGSSGLRDPIPSIASDASYITNPWAGRSPGPAQTPPPAGPPPPIPTEARRTPTRPPGLAPIDISASQQAASFLLPPLNFIPMARTFFETAEHLATTSLYPSHALRLSVALEHVAFMWDIEKDRERAVRLARRAINQLYNDQHGLDDEEFADASEIVKQLGGFVVRGQRDGILPSRQQSQEQLRSPKQQPTTRPPRIDRTIAVSPPNKGARAPRAPSQSPIQRGPFIRTPDRLSTVPEVESVESVSSQTLVDPPVSRLSSRSRQRRTSSATSDKASKRRAVEQAEEMYRRNSASNRSSVAGSQSSRQATPTDGYVRRSPPKPSRKRHGGNG